MADGDASCPIQLYDQLITSGWYLAHMGMLHVGALALGSGLGSPQMSLTAADRGERGGAPIGAQRKFVGI